MTTATTGPVELRTLEEVLARAEAHVGLRDVTVHGVDLSGRNLSAGSHARVAFIDVSLKGATFAGSRLEDVRFHDCDLTDVDLSQS